MLKRNPQEHFLQGPWSCVSSSQFSKNKPGNAGNGVKCQENHGSSSCDQAGNDQDGGKCKVAN